MTGIIPFTPYCTHPQKIRKKKRKKLHGFLLFSRTCGEKFHHPDIVHQSVPVDRWDTKKPPESAVWMNLVVVSILRPHNLQGGGFQAGR